MDEAIRGSDPSSLSRALVSPAQLAAYEHLLFQPEWSAATLAAALDCDEETACDVVTSLHEHGLVRPSEEDRARVVVVSPRVGLARATGAAEQDLLAHNEYVHRLRVLTNSLTERYDEARAARTDEASSEVLNGRDATVVRIGELVRDCATSVDSVVAASPSPTALDHARAGDEALLARGVKVRAIYQEGHRRQSTALRAHLEWLAERGADVRLAGLTPVRLMIFDGRTAAVALDPTQLESGAVVVHSPGVVHALTALFDLLWESARAIWPEPAAPAAGRVEHPLSEIESAVIRLLARGNKDEAISRRTGLSVRSVRRVIATLMGRLNANSRFELGLRCRDRGFI